MSNVVSPRGPLPPKVYWRRRMLTLALVVGVVVLLGRLLTGGEESAPVADRSTPTPSATATPPQPTPSGAARSARPARQQGQVKKPSRARRSGQVKRSSDARGRQSYGGEVSSLRNGAAGPLAQSSGECDQAEVVVAPDVEDTDALGPVPLRLGVSTNGDQACTFAFGPDTVAVQVTSGDDQIWQSVYCERALEEQSVVLRPGWLSYVTVDWSGRRGDEGCGDGNEFAQPGYYWAEAAAIGGEPVRAQFELETPPKPEPKAKANARTQQRQQDAGAEAGRQPTQRSSQQPSPKPSDEPSEKPSPESTTQPSEKPGQARSAPDDSR